MDDCIFCQIGQAQADTHLYSDERCFVIRDIAPSTPTHLLVIPRQHVTSLQAADPAQEALVGHLFTIAEQMARQEQVHQSGYRLVINQGRDAGQGVDHLHLHVLGGKQLPPLG